MDEGDGDISYLCINEVHPKGWVGYVVHWMRWVNSCAKLFIKKLFFRYCQRTILKIYYTLNKPGY